jgi:hypothetical protein
VQLHGLTVNNELQRAWNFPEGAEEHHENPQSRSSGTLYSSFKIVKRIFAD